MLCAVLYDGNDIRPSAMFGMALNEMQWTIKWWLHGLPQHLYVFTVLTKLWMCTMQLPKNGGTVVGWSHCYRVGNKIYICIPENFPKAGRPKKKNMYTCKWLHEYDTIIIKLLFYFINNIYTYMVIP